MFRSRGQTSRHPLDLRAAHLPELTSKGAACLVVISLMKFQLLRANMNRHKALRSIRPTGAERALQVD